MPSVSSDSGSQNGNNSSASHKRSGSDSTVDDLLARVNTPVGTSPASSGVESESNTFGDGYSYKLESSPRNMGTEICVPRSCLGMQPNDILAQHGISLSTSPPDIGAWLRKVKPLSNSAFKDSELSKALDEQKKEKDDRNGSNPTSKDPPK